MLQKTFGIANDVVDGCRLFIEAGKKHVACWCKDAETGAVKGFELFQFDVDDKTVLNDVLGEIRLYSKLLNRGLTLETVFIESEEAMPVPRELYREEDAEQYLCLLFGSSLMPCHVISRPVGKQVIISRQYNEQVNALNSHFKNPVFKHKFSVLLNKYLHDAAEGSQSNRVYVIFYSTHFILTAFKGNTLQLIRSISFSTGEDALYNIMQVCSQYNMPLGETSIIASGLIDTASNLYNVLYGYLEHFTFESNAAQAFEAEGFTDYPTHYFLPFLYE